MGKYEVRTDPILIDAPVEVVWDVLTDVKNYRRWNRFTPQVRTTFSIGSRARLRVKMGPVNYSITETVYAVEKPRLIAWRKIFIARLLLLTVREQHLEPLDGSSCRYHNTDRLTGLLAPVVAMFFGGYMRRGFVVVGKGLKRHAEAMYAQKMTPGID